MILTALILMSFPLWTLPLLAVVAVSLELREYQKQARENIAQKFREGIRRTVCQAPTGAGKGVIAAFLMIQAVQKGRKCLFLAHRMELLDQVYEKLAMCIPEENMGIIRGGERTRRRPTAPIQIATVQSLVNKVSLPPADLVIVDECHRVANSSYSKILEQYPKVALVGFSATPIRLDGKGLDEAFDDIVVAAWPSSLIASGWIVKPRIFSHDEDSPSVEGIKTVQGDYDKKELGKRIADKPKRIGSIVDHWKNRAQGLRTICFAFSVEDSKKIVEQFIAAGVKAVHVDGKTPERERRAALEDLRAGKVEVLSNADLYCEGVDVPSVKCIVMARPTQSLTVYLQQIGRCVRPYEGIVPIVLDHAGNAIRHGHPSMDREFKLSGRTKRTGGREGPMMRRCKECHALFEATVTVCPECGLEVEEKERTITQVDGTLVEMAEPTQEEIKKQFWKRTWFKSWEDGNQPQWVVMRYREKFGEDPPSDWGAPERPVKNYTPEQKRKELIRLTGIAFRQGLGSNWVDKKYQVKFGELPPKDGDMPTDVPKLTEQPLPSPLDGDGPVEGDLT